MLKKHMLACLLVTAVAVPAFAQNTMPSGSTDRPAATGSGSTTSGSPAMTPGANSSTMAPSGSASSAMPSASGQFMTKAEANQVMASKLIGTRVMGANNESIGDINDVIMDRSGQAVAAVVGVGGFLGIGEKDVAVPFSALEFQSEAQVSAMNNANANATAPNSPATTGSTTAGSTGTMGTAGTGTMASNNAQANTGSTALNNPERVMLRMTKEELQAAPKFDPSANR
ncbi:PRC-barrel domain-containing protein [Microvirga pudoricolor]|uniref:PRC-barrel domain-containing protein n=1 Tax=Microvirga pudoricolor TaxID=2778729 RepID=UPI0019512D39|nr:PRC-barrel domain-containing protein [Microvirga pudoricolor]MBM6592572.1 PRC-barrel domain-containing protein [Microvirga pudoricolor]